MLCEKNNDIMLTRPRPNASEHSHLSIVFIASHLLHLNYKFLDFICSHILENNAQTEII